MTFVVPQTEILLVGLVVNLCLRCQVDVMVIPSVLCCMLLSHPMFPLCP